MLNPEYLDTSRQYVKEGMSAHDLAQRIIATCKKIKTKVAQKKEVKKIMMKARMKLGKMKLCNKKKHEEFQKGALVGKYVRVVKERSIYSNSFVI